MDLLLAGGGGFTPDQKIVGHAPGLYRNLGSWRFEDVTAVAAADRDDHYSHGICAADYDNDGFTDVLITGYGGLVLLQNQGDGTFRAVPKDNGLTDELWSASAAWADFNGDGALDLYVAHYVDWSFEKHLQCDGPRPGLRDVCSPRRFDPLPDTVYHSDGAGGFRDVSDVVGLPGPGPGAGKGLGVVAADVDLDGHIDVYVGNDTVANFLFRNDGHGRFEDVSLSSGAALSAAGMPDGSMGVAVGDYNGDGLPDLWVANYERESFAMYQNRGNCLFQPVSETIGVTAVGGAFVGWGTVFADFDLDADEDIMASNGHVIRYPAGAPLRQTPLLYLNQSGRHLKNVADSAGEYFSTPHMGRGVACADLDNDGDLDLVGSHVNEPVVLLENVTAHAHHWIALQLIGISSSRSPVGAIVTVTSGGRVQVKQAVGGGSYASTCDPRIHFGLGADGSAVDLHVRWPSGLEQSFERLPVDRQWILVEGEAALLTSP